MKTRIKFSLTNPDTIIFKYRANGQLLWENIYKETTLGVNSGEIAVDTDVFIAFSGEFTSVAQTNNHIRNDTVFVRKDIKLVGITSNGITKFNKTMVTSLLSGEPLSFSSPSFIKGRLYITTAKGRYHSKGAQFDTGSLIGVTKSGRKFFLSLHTTDIIRLLRFLQITRGTSLAITRCLFMK